MTTRACDALFENLRIATMAENGVAYGLVDDGAIAVADRRILWLGPVAELPGSFRESAVSRWDMGGCLATPGLIDCHTHIVYGGDRAREFELRLQGASYEEIARAGGGIRSTVEATRAASVDELVATALPRVARLLAEGVTTIEIKSGYGLDRDTEIAMLKAASAIETTTPLRVMKTFLGAHAVPPEFGGRADDYIDFVCAESLPAAHESVAIDAVDAFCETIGFTVAQVERVFRQAGDLGLPVKLHAEQLSDQKGAILAARHGALSADHLEYVERDGVAALAEAGTVAVLLPGAFYFLRETKLPPVDMFRASNVPIALATDNNPGSSPVTSILLMLNMACTLFRLTPEEALAGVTRNAAKALGLTDIGVLREEAMADIAFWNVDHPAVLAYRIGDNPIRAVVKEGDCVFGDLAEADDRVL